MVASAITSMTGLGSVLTQDQEILVDIEAQRAQDLIDQARRDAGAETAMQEYVLVMSETSDTFDDPTLLVQVEELAADLRTTEHVASVVAPTDGVPGLLSEDRRVALLQVALDTDDWGEAAERAEPLVAVTQAAGEADGIKVVAIGTGSINLAFNDLAEQTLQRGETLGAPIALVVLVLVFGAALGPGRDFDCRRPWTDRSGGAADRPQLLHRQHDHDDRAGRRYRLLVVRRAALQRGAIGGRTVVDAVSVAGATATRAVAFSGMTLVIAAGVLLLAAAPYLAIEIGSNSIASLPEDSDVRVGFETLNREFLGGVLNTPIVVSATDIGNHGAARRPQLVLPALARLAARDTCRRHGVAGGATWPRRDRRRIITRSPLNRPSSRRAPASQALSCGSPSSQTITFQHRLQ